MHNDACFGYSFIFRRYYKSLKSLVPVRSETFSFFFYSTGPHDRERIWKKKRKRKKEERK